MLATKDELKLWLLGAESLNDPTEDTLVTSLIMDAQEVIEAHCGQELEAGERTDYYLGKGKTDILLNRAHPINSVTSAHYRSAPSSDWTELTGCELWFMNDVYRLYHENGFEKGYHYKVVYNTGYSTIPRDLKQVCMEMAAVKYRERQGNFGIKTEIESFTDHSKHTQFDNKWPDWEDRLGKYRIITV